MPNSVSNAKLSLYIYNPTSGSYTNYGERMIGPSFGSIAPGGYKEFTCKIRVPSTSAVPPELATFSKVVVTGLGQVVWMGRIDEPALAFDSGDGPYFSIHAMGPADALKDDPADAAYSSQTAAAIFGNQLSSRSAFLPIDQDTSGIVIPDTSDLFSPAFQTKTFEDALTEVLPCLGDYTWGVWEHPNNRDAFGQPTAQLVIHPRDTSSANLHWEALAYDQDTLTITPTVEYSFNVVQIKYTDVATGLPASVTVKDTRLNSDGSQGSAPFPRRKTVQDLTSDHLTAAEAALLANGLLNQYLNGGFKVEMDLYGVRDGSHTQLPLWLVRSDQMIRLPDVLPSPAMIPIADAYNVTTWYIVEATYTEQEGDALPVMHLALQTFWDYASFQLARMQYIHQKLLYDGKVHQTAQAAGVPEFGFCSFGFPSLSTAGSIWSVGVNYKSVMTSAPASVTLTLLNQINSSGQIVLNITNTGFEYDVTAAANGSGNARSSYKTNGN